MPRQSSRLWIEASVLVDEFRAGAFSGTLLDEGVLHVTFDRPPVNAFSIAEYEALEKLTEYVEQRDEVKALVVSAPPDARAWCGGADLRDFQGITEDGRRQRYEHINRILPRFHALDRPTIAAIHGAAVGVGMVWSSLFDFRVAVRTAQFALPEIDFGLMSGCAGRFVALRLPEPKLREMLYTGQRYSAGDLELTGFFNYIVGTEDLLPRSMELARLVARKDSLAMRARKRDSIVLEGSEWLEAYLRAQSASAQLVETPASRRGVESALRSRQT